MIMINRSSLRYSINAHYTTILPDPALELSTSSLAYSLKGNGLPGLLGLAGFPGLPPDLPGIPGIAGMVKLKPLGNTG